MATAWTEMGLTLVTKMVTDGPSFSTKLDDDSKGPKVICCTLPWTIAVGCRWFAMERRPFFMAMSAYQRAQGLMNGTKMNLNIETLKCTCVFHEVDVYVFFVW